MPHKKEVNLHTIARLCGVSIATVSRVLNSDPKVAESTRRRVLEALEASGYQPPTAAAGAVRKVGVVIDTQVNDYYRALVVQLHDALAEAGLRTITASLGYRHDAAPEILRTVYDCNVCGVILITCGYLSLREVLDPRLPHVWIDCNDPPEVTEAICQVQSDHLSSGVLAAQELYRKGSVNPIILTGAGFSHRMRDRFEGFRGVYRKQGIELGEDRIVHTPRVREALEESKKIVRYLISTNFAFDGIFAISDWRALGAYLAVSELGIKVPEEVKIIGFDGVSAAIKAVSNITSIQQDITQIARSARDLLTAQMEDRPISTRRIVIPTSILPGQTL